MRALITIALLALASCAGVEARDHALLPVAQQVYVNVRSDIDRGIADAVEDNDLDAAGAAASTALADQLGSILDSGDRAQLASFPWPTLEARAARGVPDLIDHGDVSAGGATVLLQRIVNFRDVLATLGSRVSTNLAPHDRPSAAPYFIKGRR